MKSIQGLSKRWGLTEKTGTESKPTSVAQGHPHRSDHTLRNSSQSLKKNQIRSMMISKRSLESTYAYSKRPTETQTDRVFEQNLSQWVVQLKRAAFRRQTWTLSRDRPTLFIHITLTIVVLLSKLKSTTNIRKNILFYQARWYSRLRSIIPMRETKL